MFHKQIYNFTGLGEVREPIIIIDALFAEYAPLHIEFIQSWLTTITPMCENEAI